VSELGGAESVVGALAGCSAGAEGGAALSVAVLGGVASDSLDGPEEVAACLEAVAAGTECRADAFGVLTLAGVFVRLGAASGGWAGVLVSTGATSAFATNALEAVSVLATLAGAVEGSIWLVARAGIRISLLAVTWLSTNAPPRATAQIVPKAMPK